MIKFIAILSMIFSTNLVFAQPNLILRDINGTRLGTFVNFMDDGAITYLRYSTFDGYIVTVQANTQNLTIKFEELEFESDDCSGQAYSSQALGDPGFWYVNGVGQILQVGDTFKNGDVWHGQAAILGWGDSYNTNKTDILANSQLRSYETGEPFRCLSYGSEQPRTYMFPVRLIDLENYGFHATSEGIVILPLGEPAIDKSDIIYCNSFENCPIP